MIGTRTRYITSSAIASCVVGSRFDMALMLGRYGRVPTGLDSGLEYGKFKAEVEQAKSVEFVSVGDVDEKQKVK
jgi:hypothetical protein